MSLSFRHAFQLPRGLPAVHDWHFQVHQDDVRPLSDRHLAASLAILRGHHLESPRSSSRIFEHVDIVIVVFDIK